MVLIDDEGSRSSIIGRLKELAEMITALETTAMVIFLVLVVSFFLGLIDFGLIKVIKNIVG